MRKLIRSKQNKQIDELISFKAITKKKKKDPFFFVSIVVEKKKQPLLFYLI
jgi:hypothetical protein